jgi:hypothetical protein
MLTVSHAIMQNEAIIALTILCAVCSSEDVDSNESNERKIEVICDELIKSDFVKQLNVMLEKNAGKIQSEIAENLCKFLNLIMSEARIKKQMIENDSLQLFQRLVTDNSNLNDNAKISIESVIREISNLNSDSKQ